MIDGGYWIKSVREGDRVTSRYLGKDEWGLGLAVIDVEIRERRRAERRERDRAEEAGRRLLAAERRRGAAVRWIVAVTLEGMGFTRYRGTSRWRRTMTTEVANRDAGAPPGRDEIKALIARARSGEAGALARLTAIAKAHPKAVATAVSCDLHAAAKLLLAKELSKEPAMQVAVEAGIDAMEADLAGPGAGLPTLLTARVVAYTGVEFWTLTADAARKVNRTTPADLRRQHAAGRRYAMWLRTLATIKRLEEG
jgi:hypothetical protein